MPRRRTPDPTTASVPPETVWLVMTGRTTTSCAAAKGDRDLARDWVTQMQDLARQDVDEEDPSAVLQLVTPEMRDGLRAEADDHDFVPWAISGCRPTGEGFTRWHRAFIARYDRRGG